ncbi:MAG: hypothetical protein ACRC33_00760, partial [Gemmataceae bacterium]
MSTRQPAARRGPAPGFAIDPWLLLRSLRRRWLLIAVLGSLLGGAVGWAIWTFLPPGNQTAYRLLHFAAHTPNVAFANHEGPNFETFKATQLSLLRGRAVLNAAIRKPNVAATATVKGNPSALEWLEQTVRASHSGPEIVQVSLSGPPEQIADLRVIVDAVTDEYLSQVVDKDQQRRELHQDQLRKIAKTYEDKLRGIRQSMSKYRDRGVSSDPLVLALQQDQAARGLSAATLELTKLRGEIRELGAQLTQMEAGKTDGFAVTDAEIQAAVSQDPSFRNEADQLALTKRKVDKDADRAVKGRNDPHVQNLIRQLQKAEDEFKRRQQEATAGLREKIAVAKNRNAGLGVAVLKQRLTYLQTLEKLVAKDCERLTKEANALNDGAVKFEDVKHEIEEAENMLRSIHKKAEVLAVELAAPPRIRPLDNRENVVLKPNELTRKMMFSAVGGLGVLAAVALGLGLLEMRNRRLGPPTDISQQLGLNVIATLPYCKGGKGRSNALVQSML